jgi:putative Mg2+ transporter-C (MgtC) family protein
MLKPDKQELALRVLAALLCGGIIGLDRELRSLAAGMRTHALAAEGAALFTLAGILIAHEARNAGYLGADPSRVASTVAQGIGFLAAGVIFGSAARVKGLTTAAGLWATAAIGMLCGAGFYFLAFFATAATVAVLSLFKVIENRVTERIKPDGEDVHDYDIQD